MNIHFKLFLSSLFVAILTQTSIYAQDTYRIIKVKGQIFNVTTGNLIKDKTSIKSTDKVKFKSKNAKALIYSRRRGRFILRAQPQPGGKFNPEFLTLVRRTIFAQRSGTYTMAAIYSKKDFIDLFSAKKPLLLLEELELEFSEYTLNQINKGKKGVFFVRFKYDEKTINLPLKLVDGKKIILSQDNLFRTKKGLLDQTKVKEMIFSYAIPQNGKGMEVLKLKDGEHLTFQPKFLSKEELKENGIYNLAEYLHEVEKDQGEVVRELYLALSVYGTPVSMNVNDWYQNNFKKK